MKRLLIVLIGALIAVPAFAGDAKMGFVDLQKVLNESTPGIKAKAEIEAMFKERKAQIDEKIKEVEKLKDDLKKQALVLSEDARREKSEQISAKEKEIDRLTTDTREFLDKEQRKREMDIIKKMDGAIDAYGKEQGYTLIIPREVVLYWAENTDLTAEIIKRINAGEKAAK